MPSTGPGDPLVFSNLVDRQVRVGDITDQCRSTWDKIGEALEQRQADDAAALTEFAVEKECRFVHDILTGWATEIRALLSRRGVPADDLVLVDERLRDLLAYPDGEPYSPEVGWLRLEDAKRSLQARIEAGAWEEAEAAVPAVCEAWRVLHDRVVDASFGWMSAFVERFGETAVPEMYEEIGGEHFAEFFALADPERRAWEDEGCAAVLLDTIEAMRVHLSTTRRDGAPIELVEHEDRWEMAFDPCDQVAVRLGATSSKTPPRGSSRRLDLPTSRAPTTGRTARQGCASTAITASFCTSSGRWIGPAFRS
jgi:hypothetical protein